MLDRTYEALPATVSQTDTLEADGPDPLLGAVCGGRYELVSVLGEGGMSVVYLARHLELERDVAVKVMHVRADDGTARERFAREARTVGGLRHPNIVEVYDIGTLPDGRPYFVMPKVEGSDLADRIERGLCAPEEVVRLLAGPAAALDLVHERGIVHRDIKPENLMLRRLADGTEVVQLVDFGVAAFADGSKRLTASGMVTGTPHYMSPEAAQGVRADRRGDVYSLAVVVFEAITGELPFDSESMVTLLTTKIREPAPALADKLVAKGVSVDPAVEAVVAKGLARDPADRYSSAGALIDALRSAVGGSLPPPRLSAPALDLAHTIPEVRALSRDEVPVHVAPARTPEPRPPASRPPPSRPFASSPPARPRSARWLLPLLVFGLATVVSAWALHVQLRPAPLQVEQATPLRAPPPPEVASEVNEASDAPVPAGADQGGPRLAVEPEAVEPSSARVGTSVESPTWVAHERSARASGLHRQEAPDPDPTRASQRTQAGTRALMQGQVASAAQHFRAATLAAPGHAPAWRGLGLSLERMGRRAEARRAYVRYLSLDADAGDRAEVSRRVAELGSEG